MKVSLRSSLVALLLASGILGAHIAPVRAQGSGAFPGEEPDPHAEIRRLVGEVERTLREVDASLSEASSAGHATERSNAIEATRAESRRAIEGIDRILELARHEHPPGGT